MHHKKSISVVLLVLCLLISACGVSEEEANISSGDFDIMALIGDKVELSDDVEIESHEWVNDEQTCLRVRVQYKEQPENNYRHKEDYFFFVSEDGEIKDSLFVDYPDKETDTVDSDRYPLDACDFSAHFEDVTFDEEDDLLISLGHQGTHGTLLYCAYVYQDGTYEYEKSFEQIPNYEVEPEQKMIKGQVTNSAASYTEYEFSYTDGAFVEVNRTDYMWE